MLVDSNILMYAAERREGGRWEFTGKFWMDPTEPPPESVGTVVRELMLGGRVLAEKVRSTYMDKPFEGYGLTGYDNGPRSSGAPGTTTWAPGSC